eukprot:3797362-Amphidinium_carterae.1
MISACVNVRLCARVGACTSSHYDHIIVQIARLTFALAVTMLYNKDGRAALCIWRRFQRPLLLNRPKAMS